MDTVAASGCAQRFADGDPVAGLLQRRRRQLVVMQRAFHFKTEKLVARRVKSRSVSLVEKIVWKTFLKLRACRRSEQDSNLQPRVLPTVLR